MKRHRCGSTLIDTENIIDEHVSYDDILNKIETTTKLKLFLGYIKRKVALENKTLTAPGKGEKKRAT